MHVLAIANQKGGVGKTTLAALVAFYFAQKRKCRVLAVDLDSQANLSTTLREFRVEVPASALFGDAPLSLPAVRPAIALLHGAPALADLELGLAAAHRRRVRTFVAQLASLREAFDVCVIDSPPTAGLRMVGALAAADFVVVPIELERYSRDGVKAMLQMVFGVRAEYNPRVKLLGLLPSRVMSGQPRQRAALADVFAHYGDYLVPGQVAISTRSAIPRALEEGIPVWQLPRAVAHEASAEVLRALEALAAAMQPTTEETAS
ncbi:MAG: ParA family protein [Myxococcota bacterium]|nr:ParA family protein [Myxococcota bacterium]MCU0895966.1 ParA family protein [Burkholderiales bacterium]